MATTGVNLYRSLIGDAAKLRIRNGTPDPGMLDPRWEDSEYEVRGETFISRADVTFVMDAGVSKVEANKKGTSLHDVAAWFGGREFWIPSGTEYSDEILIVRDKHEKTNKRGTATGFHYMLTAKTRMTQTQMSGYLNNMARAAVVKQVELAK